MENHILVFCGKDQPDEQPETFRFCPLGVQFYSRDKLPEYQQLEMDLSGAPGVDLPSPSKCEGIVVHCQYDRIRRLYRNWILFVDIPEELRNRFKCLAKGSGLLCPHCENF